MMGGESQKNNLETKLKDNLKQQKRIDEKE